MADPAFDSETIADLDVDNVAEGATKLKHLNNAIRELITSLQTTFAVEHDTDTGKHTEKYFTKTVTIAMGSATTETEIIPDSDVTDDRKVYITSIYGYVATTASVQSSTTDHLYIKDNAGVNLWRIRYDKLESGDHFNIITRMKSSDNSITWVASGAQAALREGTGGTANYGIKAVGDLNSSSATNVYLTVSGIIK